MAQNDEIILININGADRPGVTLLSSISVKRISITIYHWVSCFKARKEIPAIY